MRLLQDYMMVMVMVIVITICFAGLSALGLDILKKEFSEAVSTLSKEQ